MSPLHQNHPQQAAGHRADTLVGYVALQREADLARAAARSTPTPVSPTSISPTLRALAPAVGTRLRHLLWRASVTRRPGPVVCSPTSPAVARLGAAKAELACCA